MTRSEAKRLKLTTTLADAHALADRALATVRAKHARSAERSPRATGATREERRQAARERTANVRVEVFKRDGGRCVVCGDEATDMHHLVYGSGMRRVLETGKTCAALCRPHHDLAHAGRWSTLEALQLWASGNGFWMANEALVRRLEKIAARERTALRAPSTPATNTKEDDRHE